MTQHFATKSRPCRVSLTPLIDIVRQAYREETVADPH